MTFSKTTSVTQYGNGITKRSVSINNGHGTTITRTSINRGGYGNPWADRSHNFGGRPDYRPQHGFWGRMFNHRQMHHAAQHRPQLDYHNYGLQYGPMNYGPQHRPYFGGHNDGTRISVNGCGASVQTPEFGLNLGAGLLKTGFNFIKNLFAKKDETPVSAPATQPEAPVSQPESQTTQIPSPEDQTVSGDVKTETPSEYGQESTVMA